MTEYRLSIAGDDNYVEIITRLREECSGANYALNNYGGCLEECKWYSCEDDMTKFSKKYPDLLFCMEGKGEDFDDIWRLWFKNGKSQYTKAQIVYDDYDESKLT